MFNSFKCILLCNRTATKFHNHFYITSVCHNHGREGEMRNLPGVFLSSRLPRLSRAQGFFWGGTSHVTIRPDHGIWSTGEIMKCSLLHVFITPFLLILKKKFVIPSDYSTKKDIISWTPNFRYLFHHPGNHATLLPAEENFVTFGIDRYIGIPLSPSHTNCPMSRIQD